MTVYIDNEDDVLTYMAMERCGDDYVYGYGETCQEAKDECAREYNAMKWGVLAELCGAPVSNPGEGLCPAGMLDVRWSPANQQTK